MYKKQDSNYFDNIFLFPYIGDLIKHTLFWDANGG